MRPEASILVAKFGQVDADVKGQMEPNLEVPIGGGAAAYAPIKCPNAQMFVSSTAPRTHPVRRSWSVRWPQELEISAGFSRPGRATIAPAANPPWSA